MLFRSEGIGEKLSKLPPMVKCPVLIAKPQISVSTKFVYENLKLGSDMVHPDIDRLVADIREKDLYKIAADMGNEWSASPCGPHDNHPLFFVPHPAQD
mgnify:CR=1 FL=1